jgi:hypothetical protein
VIILYGAEYLRTAHFTHITLNENKILSISRPKPGVHKLRAPGRPGFMLSGGAYICRSLVWNLLLVDFLAPKILRLFLRKVCGPPGLKNNTKQTKRTKKFNPIEAVTLEESIHSKGFFPCFFLSCRANVTVKLAKTGHGPHFSTFICICVVRLFVLFYVLFVCKCVLPPGDNPIAVNKYININKIKVNITKTCQSWEISNETQDAHLVRELLINRRNGRM